MGNCQSEYGRHHVRIEDPGIRKFGPSVRKSTRILISYDGRNGIFVDDDLDPTIPLSPDATTLTTTSSFSTPLDPYESPSSIHVAKSKHSDHDETVLSPSGTKELNISLFHSLTSSKSRRYKSTPKSFNWDRYEHSRRNFTSALRARLERSTFTTMVSPTDTESYNDSDIPFFTWDDYRTNLESRFSEEAQDETYTNAFNAGDANIWTEIETSDAVIAVALFPHRSNLDRINLAVVTKNGNIVVHEILDGSDSSKTDKLAVVFTLEHKARIRSIDFSFDGRFFAVGDDDCLCTIYSLVYDEDTLCGATVVATRERVDRVCALQFSPQNNLLAIGGFDGTVVIVSTENLSEGHELNVVTEINADGLVFAVDWSPDGQFLAIGGNNKKCMIVDASKNWEITTEIRRHAPVQSVKWSPLSNGEIAIGSSNTAIFDLKRMRIKQEITSKPKPLSIRKTNRSQTMCWSPNANYFVTEDSVNFCQLFEAKSFTKVQSFQRNGSINAICWYKNRLDSSCTNSYLVIGSEDSKVVIVKTGDESIETKSLSTEQKADPANSTQLGSQQEGSEWVFNENAFEEIDEFVGEAPCNPVVKKTSSKVVAITFSRGIKSRPSAFIAYATDDNQVTVLSTSEWSPIAEISFPQPVTALAFTNGSKYLAYGCLDSRLYVSETHPNWSLVANIELACPIHNSLIYSTDNQLLGAGMYDGSFVLFDPQQKYAICRSIEGNGSPITSVDWSSKTIAIGKEDGTVQLYDAETIQSGDVKAIATITKRNAIRSVAFGLSGRFLAMGLSDGLVCIYSEKGGWVLCHQLQSMDGGVSSLTWSPTSRYLAVGDDQGSIRIMDTVFWADVDKAKRTFNRQKENPLSNAKSALTFSQDGTLLGFARSNSGIHVADSNYWNLQFSLVYTNDDDITAKSNESVEE